MDERAGSIHWRTRSIYLLSVKNPANADANSTDKHTASCTLANAKTEPVCYVYMVIKPVDSWCSALSLVATPTDNSIYSFRRYGDCTVANREASCGCQSRATSEGCHIVLSVNAMEWNDSGGNNWLVCSANSCRGAKFPVHPSTLLVISSSPKTRPSSRCVCLFAKEARANFIYPARRVFLPAPADLIWQVINSVGKSEPRRQCGAASWRHPFIRNTGPSNWRQAGGRLDDASVNQRLDQSGGVKSSDKLPSNSSPSVHRYLRRSAPANLHRVRKFVLARSSANGTKLQQRINNSFDRCRPRSCSWAVRIPSRDSCSLGVVMARIATQSNTTSFPANTTNNTTSCSKWLITYHNYPLPNKYCTTTTIE